MFDFDGANLTAAAILAENGPLNTCTSDTHFQLRAEIHLSIIFLSSSSNNTRKLKSSTMFAAISKSPFPPLTCVLYPWPYY